MSGKRAICHLTATAGDLRKLLDTGEYESVELVDMYLNQISKHNHDGMKLNAIISTRPLDDALAEARALDAERAQSGPWSRLHGIAIVLKVDAEPPKYPLTSELCLSFSCRI